MHTIGSTSRRSPSPPSPPMSARQSQWERPHRRHRSVSSSSASSVSTLPTVSTISLPHLPTEENSFKNRLFDKTIKAIVKKLVRTHVIPEYMGETLKNKLLSSDEDAMEHTHWSADMAGVVA